LYLCNRNRVTGLEVTCATEIEIGKTACAWSFQENDFDALFGSGKQNSVKRKL
jgi:hypothetical protein